MIFLDYSNQFFYFRHMVRTSVLVAGVGLAAVLLLILLLSGRIIKPVSESYEKQKRFITDAGHELKTPLPSSRLTQRSWPWRGRRTSGCGISGSRPNAFLP